MCYPKPAPRCSTHALQALNRAKASGNPTAIATAQRDFDLTPAGITALREAGSDLQADMAQQLRQALIAQTKTQHTDREAEPTPPIETDEMDDAEHRAEAAADPATSAELLTQLAHDEDWSVRYNVAGNTSTPPEILLELAQDETFGIRASVAGNPATPPELLTKLAEDEDENVRWDVASNPATPPELLYTLAVDRYDYVRLGVAHNRSSPPEVLTALASYYEPTIRSAVARNTSCPSEVLAHLANDKDSDVLNMVSENTNTPIEVLFKLRDKGKPIHKGQLTRITAAIEVYRQKEGLEGFPDSYIEKLLWG